MFISPKSNSCDWGIKYSSKTLLRCPYNTCVRVLCFVGDFPSSSSSSSSSNFIPNRIQAMKDGTNEWHNNNHKHWWSCWWSPEKPEAHRAGNQKKILFLSEWWGAGPHRVNLKFDNTVLNDASYLTWYILGVIMMIIDTPVSFGINYRSEWERWRVACGSSFYTIIDLWFVNVDSINVHLWYHNG